MLRLSKSIASYHQLRYSLSGNRQRSSYQAELSSETRQHGSSVALTAGQENKSTLWCSLTKSVAERARDDEGGKTFGHSAARVP